MNIFPHLEKKILLYNWRDLLVPLLTTGVILVKPCALFPFILAAFDGVTGLVVKRT
jgi:hypothetical protein